MYLKYVDKLDWSDEPGYRYIEDIEALSLDKGSIGIVGQGRILDTRSDDGRGALVSDGFGKCAAVILRGSVEGSWALAHVQPLDYQLYRLLRDINEPIEEALLIFGSVSVHQHDVVQWLREIEVPYGTLRPETGGAHFGVALDTQLGKLSVVRKTPDQSIFVFDPFKAK